jgi:hypothetical protein
MNMATRSNGDVLALGFHDVQDLILGTVDFLDIWVNLQVASSYWRLQYLQLHALFIYAAAILVHISCCVSVYTIASAT